MSDNCSSCSSCPSDCNEKKEKKTDFTANLHKHSKIKKVIGIVSGKGGVGKSIVTSMLAVLANRAGHNTAILDADITGPSIPKAFGIEGKAIITGEEIYPAKTKTGISVMSINLLLDDAAKPVVWRGPIIAGAVKQFWTDVIWDNIDYMFIDMPPGTGDVPLTVFQSIPVDGIVIVTSPQELVGMIVEKAVNMAKMMNIPILGIVENMSYAVCPDCDKEIQIFGESRVSSIVEKYGIQTVSKIPLVPALAASCDKGVIDLFEGSWLDNMIEMILQT